MPKRGSQDAEGALTSLRVFRKFIKRHNDPETGAEILSAEGVISRECYELWIGSRKSPPPRPEKAFQRALTAHLGGVDGRSPFSAVEEDAILKVLRRKEKWPCFEGSKIRFGLMGFRTLGFHERKEHNGEPSNESDDLDEEQMGEDDHTGDEHSLRTSLKSTKRESLLASPKNATKRIRRSVQVVDDASSETYSSDASAQSIAIERERLVQLAPDAHVGYFFSSAANMLANFQHTAYETWERILSLLKYVVLSRGNHRLVDVEALRTLFNDAVRESPDKFIAVFDTIPSHPSKRLIYMCNWSREIFGPVTRDELGITKSFVTKASMWTLLRLLVVSWRNPEQPTYGDVMCRDKHGQEFPVRICISSFPRFGVVLAKGEPLADDYIPVSEGPFGEN